MHVKTVVRQTFGASVPLSNASLMRFTSRWEPGTRNMPSWWRPEKVRSSRKNWLTCTRSLLRRERLTVKVYEPDAAFNHHRYLLPGALGGGDTPEVGGRTNRVTSAYEENSVQNDDKGKKSH